MAHSDAYLVQTSGGDLNIQFGWNSWVSIEAPGRPTRQAVVSRRPGLERLLVQVGVEEQEARAIAPGLWKKRPRGFAQGHVEDAWADPWKRHGNATLILFLAGIATAFLYIVVFKLDWIAV